MHPNFTSFVLSPAVQHAFTTDNLLELEGTATELVAGEGALRKAFGGLWRALEGDLADHVRAEDDDRDDGDHGTRTNSRSTSPTPGKNRENGNGHTNGNGNGTVNGLEEHAPPLHRLFISPASITLPTDPRAVLIPQSQIDSLDWALGVLRELADDGREYTARLEEIRDGLGKAGEVRNVVWKAVREEAVEEMESGGR